MDSLTQTWEEKAMEAIADHQLEGKIEKNLHSGLLIMEYLSVMEWGGLY